MTTVITPRPLPTRGRRLTLFSAGAAAVCCAPFALGLPVSDTAILVGVAAGGAVLAAAALILASRSLSSVRGLLVLTALVPVAATVVGAATASSLMFLSEHDLRALVVVLLVSGGVGLAMALVLSERVAKGAAAVADLARSVDAGPVRLDWRPLPDELRAVAEGLEDASRRRVEAAAREAAMDISRRELVAWVSHDLRTPLTEIRAMSAALEGGVVGDAETVARYNRTIRQEADRLAALVDDLFELSRIHEGALALVPERVPLVDVVGDAVAGASVAAAAKGVVLEGRADDEPSPLVELSTPEMARVVRNLLDNAIRHTPAGGRVEVVAGLDGPRAVVVVADACGGMADHDLDRVFDLAYRGDEARLPGDGRAGLGLAIAKGLVEAQHGSIAVANAGAGCRFTVSLPLAEGVVA